MKKLLSVVLAGVMVASLAACGSGGSGSKDTNAPQGQETGTAGSGSGQTFKIGGIGPTTGGAAVYGVAVKNGIDQAVKEINAAGGINGYQIEYQFQDDEHDAEKSVNAYNTLKDWGMQMLVGTVTSTPCEAVVEKSHADNLFQLTPSGTSVNAIQYDNAFRMCFSDPNQGKVSAEYIADNKLATKIGVIYDSSDVYSSGIYATFAQTAKEKGLEIVSAEAFTADSNKDFSVQLQKAKDAGAELLFLPIYYSETSLILTQANTLGYAPVFFGCDGFDGLLAVDNFDTKLAEGVMFLTPFSTASEDELTQNFVKTFESTYGGTPNQFAADAYDCVYVIKAAIEKAGVTPDMSVTEMCDKLKTAMTEISYTGLTGNDIKWTADGEPEKAPIVVKIVDGQYQILK